MNWSDLEKALVDLVKKELADELTKLVDSSSNSENSISTPTVPSVPAPPGANVTYAVPEKTGYSGLPAFTSPMDIVVFSGDRSDYTVKGHVVTEAYIVNFDEVVYPKYEYDPITFEVIRDPETGKPIITNEEEVVDPIWGAREVSWGQIDGFVVEANNGLEGPYFISQNVDRLYFNDDQAVALDVWSGGFNVGGTTPGRVAGQVYRMYKAAFDREPDSFGMGYWINQMDNGMDMWEMATRFIDSEEFRALYGENPTDTEFLDKLYENILDREPDGGGYAWWQYELANNPSKTREKVLADFSEGWENVNNTADLIADGIPYTIWS